MKFAIFSLSLVLMLAEASAARPFSIWVHRDAGSRLLVRPNVSLTGLPQRAPLHPLADVYKKTTMQMMQHPAIWLTDGWPGRAARPFGLRCSK